MFILAKHLADVFAALIAAACFALLSVSQSVHGVFANAEHFVILPAISGLFLLLLALEQKRKLLLFISGLLTGIGFLMKQHGVAFILCGLVYIFVQIFYTHRLTWFRLLSYEFIFLGGALTPYMITCAILYKIGVFEKFWFWTVEYAMTYISQVAPEHAWGQFLRRATPIYKESLTIWLLAFIGLTTPIWNKHLRHRFIFIFPFVLFSIVAICPGFYFRPHYFILMLPVSALLAGLSISAFANLLSHFHIKLIYYRAYA